MDADTQHSDDENKEEGVRYVVYVRALHDMLGQGVLQRFE